MNFIGYLIGMAIPLFTAIYVDKPWVSVGAVAWGSALTIVYLIKRSQGETSE